LNEKKNYDYYTRAADLKQKQKSMYITYYEMMGLKNGLRIEDGEIG
jgi:hypothetical protein